MTAVLVSQSPSISTFEGWLVVISALGFLGMVADKAFARLGVERIPETAFVVCSLAGGLLGIVLGGLVAHHKTSKPQFWVPVVLAAIPSVLLLGYYHGGSV